jgi:hypothetical protein
LNTIENKQLIYKSINKNPLAVASILKIKNIDATESVDESMILPNWKREDFLNHLDYTNEGQSNNIDYKKALATYERIKRLSMLTSSLRGRNRSNNKFSSSGSSQTSSASSLFSLRNHHKNKKHLSNNNQIIYSDVFTVRNRCEKKKRKKFNHHQNNEPIDAYYSKNETISSNNSPSKLDTNIKYKITREY